MRTPPGHVTRVHPLALSLAAALPHLLAPTAPPQKNNASPSRSHQHLLFPLASNALTLPPTILSPLPCPLCLLGRRVSMRPVRRTSCAQASSSLENYGASRDHRCVCVCVCVCVCTYSCARCACRPASCSVILVSFASHLERLLSCPLFQGLSLFIHSFHESVYHRAQHFHPHI